MKKSSSKLSNLAHFFYREWQDSETFLEKMQRSDRWILRIFMASFSLFVSLFFFAYFQHSLQWNNISAEFPVQRSDWQIAINPQKNDLWKSPTLGETAESLLKQGKIQEIWLGLQIPQERANAAAKKNANRFIMGWIKGSFEVHMNGKLFAQREDSTDPYILNLPLDLLAQKQDIQISLLVHPRKDALNLLPFTIGSNAGLATDHTANAYIAQHDFIDKSKSFGLLLVYATFSLIFFLLWTANRKYREYLHLSAFAFLCAMPELFFADGFSFRIPNSLGYQVYTLILIAKSAAALNLGLAFSRSKAVLLRQATLIYAIIGSALVFLVPPHTLLSWRLPLYQINLPLAFWLGGMSCLLQATALNQVASINKRSTNRFFRLMGFAVTLFALGALTILQTNLGLETFTRKFLWGVPDFSLVFFMGYLALLDFREQSQLLERTPVSPYHSRPELPEKVVGAIVTLDLKNSESYFQFSLNNGMALGIVPSAISQLWSRIHACDGVILKAEGDEILAFFEEKKHPNPLKASIEAIEACKITLDEFSLQMQQMGQWNDSLPPLHFRASIVVGAIKPIWIGKGAERLPAWEQKEDSMAFVESARLLEIEKSLSLRNSEPYSSVMLLSSVFHTGLLDKKDLPGTFLAENLRCIGKHRKTYEICVYAPKASTILSINNAA